MVVLLCISVGFLWPGRGCDEVASHFCICCPVYFSAGAECVPSLRTCCKPCLMAAQQCSLGLISERHCPWRAAPCLRSDSSSYASRCFLASLFFILLLLVLLVRSHLSKLLYRNRKKIGLGECSAQLHEGCSYFHSTGSHQQRAEGDCRPIQVNVIHYLYVQPRWSYSSLPSWEVLFKWGKGRSFFKEHMS